MNVKLEDYFKYHPPTTPKRIAKHEAINNAAFNFVEIVRENVDNDLSFRDIMQWIIIAKNKANETVMIQELNNQKDLTFTEENSISGNE